MTRSETKRTTEMPHYQDGTVLHVGGAALRVQEENGDTMGFEKVG